MAEKSGLDLNVTYAAIKASSGNSFVHETESQVILNGSRQYQLYMDLVLKDIGLFHQLAEEHRVPVELSPLLIEIFKDGQKRYGPREWSSNIIRRLEDACAVRVHGKGFPALLTDDEPEQSGEEIVVENRSN